MRVGRGQHPIAHGERGVLIAEYAYQSWQHLSGVLGLAVVQAHAVSVHFGQAQQLPGVDRRWVC